MKIITKGQTKQAHGKQHCFGCDSIIEVERADLRQSLMDKFDSIFLGHDRYHWQCPVCFCCNSVSEKYRTF